MLDDDYNLKLGQYIFISYSQRDRDAIMRLMLIQYLSRYFRIMIDCGNEWGFDEDTMRSVHAFEYGERWVQQIQEGANKAHCILAMCSRNTKHQLQAGKKSWLSEELRIGRENNTLFPISIDKEVDIFERTDRAFWQFHLGESYLFEQGPKLNEVAWDVGKAKLEPIFENMRQAISRKIIKRAELLRKDHGSKREWPQALALRSLIDRNRQAQRFVHASTPLAVAEAEPGSVPGNLIARFLRIDLPDAGLCRVLPSRKTQALLERHADLVISDAMVIVNKDINMHLELDYQTWRDHYIDWPDESKTPEEAATLLLRQILYQLNGGDAATLAQASDALRDWCEKDREFDGGQDAQIRNMHNTGLLENAQLIRVPRPAKNRSKLLLRGDTYSRPHAGSKTR